MLTPKQKKVLDYIQRFQAKKGFAPSQQEIANHFGFRSLGTVQNYLVRLERQGLLKKVWNARRGMKPVKKRLAIPSSQHPSMETVPIPILGKVAAGKPIEAVETQEMVQILPSLLSKTGEHFCLRVEGDSMIEEGILDGDLVIIRKQEDADNGQTVVALIDNEATIKKFYRRKRSVELHPANPTYQPIVVDSNDRIFAIEGILVSVIRKY